MLAVDTSQTVCRFALACTEITPPVGIYHRMWGAARHDRSEGVHRPLRATALWIEPRESADGAAPLIWLALDHCLFGPPELELIRDEIRRELGVVADQLVVVFSHTHGAGLMTLDRQSLPGGDLIPEYLREVGRRAARIVAQAKSELTSATIVYGQGWCGLAAHRDLWDKNRREFVCGYHPEGPSDGTVVAAKVTADDGRTLGTLVNYACHPTTLAWDNRLISPDYIGALREVVERETGAPCLFVQGASGDLGPVEGFVGDPEVADRNGRQLGFAALATLTALPPPATRYEYAGAVVSGATIGTWRHAALDDQRLRAVQTWNHHRWSLPLDYRPDLPSLPQIEAERERWRMQEDAARAADDLMQAAECRAMVERQTRMLARLQQLPAGRQYPLPIDLWRLGDAVWIAVPGELYSRFQVELRASFPGRSLVICTLAQGWGPSYIPTEETYGKGIYQESIAVLAPGSLERITAAVRSAIEELLGSG